MRWARHPEGVPARQDRQPHEEVGAAVGGEEGEAARQAPEGTVRGFRTAEWSAYVSCKFAWTGLFLSVATSYARQYLKKRKQISKIILFNQ